MTVVRDRYELRELAGSGGQGEVHRALDHMHGRDVALKVRRFSSEEERARILSEAKTILSVRPHPGIPLVRDDFFEAGRYHMVMDWIEGETLAEMGRRDTDDFDGEGILGYLADVADALDHLHAHDPPIVHKDVKPSNIIVTKEGRAVLVDFGIAAPSESGRAAGTRGFTAPEVTLGHIPTARSDVFSLAATAFTLFAGEPPRPGMSPRWRGFPRERAKIVEVALTRGLAYDPTRRPESAGALIDMLRGGGGPNNLRLHTTPFVGRETELEEVRTILGEQRMVSVVGPGGMGKTRLAEQAAGDLLAEYGDGVWFVDLSSLADPGLVGRTSALALGLTPEAGQDPDQMLVEHLQTRRVLVVIDNCEHVVEEAARVAALILQACPHVKVLATSRERLGVSGEFVWRIPALPVPDAEDRAPSRESSDSVRLFLDRAGRVGGEFVSDEESLTRIADIVRQLDGIPLAIELAAARVSSLPLSQISARIADRFRLLTGGARSGPTRQQSLRSTVDWSYELLNGDEARLLRRVSLFAAPFTMAAAEALGGPNTLENLTSLVDKSLVALVDGEQESRYRMLETIRAYGEEKLVGKGEGPEARGRHMEWFCERAEEVEAELGGADQARHLQSLEDEHDDIRKALRWATSNSPEFGLRLAGALWRFWSVRGHAVEGLRWAEELLSFSPMDHRIRARGLRAAGGLGIDLGEYEKAREYLQKGAALARKLGDRRLLAAILNALAVVAGSTGDFGMERDLYEECLGIWRELGHKRGIAVTLGNLGTSVYEQGEVEEAGRHFEESLSLRRELEDNHGIAASLNGLGLVVTAEGNLDEADSLFMGALEAWRGLGYVRGEGVALSNLASNSLARGDGARALGMYEESIEALRKSAARSHLAEALQGLSEVYVSEGRPLEALAPLRESIITRDDLGDLKGLADGLEATASAALELGDPVKAARMLGAAQKLRTTIGSVPPPQRQRARATLVTRAVETLGEAKFNAAELEGMSLSRTDAIAEALQVASVPQVSKP